jgi:hypothetical protein
MENKHEIHGLRFLNGDPTARLLNADEEFGGMLLERCAPGTRLRILPEREQARWSAASQICSVLITNGFDCGRSHAQRQNHERIGITTIPLLWLAPWVDSALV